MQIQWTTLDNVIKVLQEKQPAEFEIVFPADMSKENILQITKDINNALSKDLNITLPFAKHIGNLYKLGAKEDGFKPVVSPTFTFL